jgi:hypothetical protein
VSLPTWLSILVCLVAYLMFVIAVNIQRRRAEKAALPPAPEPQTWLDYATENDPIIAEIVAERQASLDRMRAQVRQAAWDLEEREKGERLARVEREQGELRRQRAERQALQQLAELERHRERLVLASKIDDPLIRAATYRQCYATAAEVLEMEASRDGGGCTELMIEAEQAKTARALQALGVDYRYPYESESVNARLITGRVTPGTSPSDWCYLCQRGDTTHVAHRDLASDIRGIWAS